MNRFFYFSFLSFLFLSVFMSSCEQELNLDKYRNPEMENMLVVNSILNPDSLIGVSVTHPFFFSIPHVKFEPVKGLDVQVTDKEGEWSAMTFDDESGLYLSSRNPQPGEVIEVRIAEDGKIVNTRDTIPHRVAIQDVEVTREGPMHIYWDDDYLFTYRITFQDTPGEENFYFLSIDHDALSYEFSYMGQPDFSADYVFKVLADMINKDMNGWKPDGVFGYPFCDKGIDGQRYTITVTEDIQSPLTWHIKQLARKVCLYSISRSYFEYMVSVLSMDYDESALKGNLLSLGLLEPDKIYSNIDGGAGIMGSYNLSAVHLDILKETGGWPAQ